MTVPSITEAARMRAAIARSQTQHWRRLFWEPARTKKELEHRERMWFWWGSTGWQAELAARGVGLVNEKGFSRAR